MDEDDLELDAINLYRAADFEGDVDHDHCDALDDAKRVQAAAVPIEGQKTAKNLTLNL